MKRHPKIDQVFFDNQDVMKGYAIAVCPNWKHWHATKLPLPIRELMIRYPGVAIERVSGWKGIVWKEDGEDELFDPHDIPQPVFRLGLSDDQAEAFKQDLKALSRETGEVVDDFIFLTIDRTPNPACLSDEELEAGIDLSEIDFSCFQNKVG